FFDLPPFSRLSCSFSCVCMKYILNRNFFVKVSSHIGRYKAMKIGHSNFGELVMVLLSTHPLALESSSRSISTTVPFEDPSTSVKLALHTEKQERLQLLLR